MGTNRDLSKSDRFQRQLAWGQLAETDIAKYLINLGAHILPVYDIEYEDGKGPRVFGKDCEIVAPDLFVFHQGKMGFIESKRKTVFSWYRIGKRWVTGIDLRHYEHYLRLRRVLSVPIDLMFLHESSVPDPRDRQFPCCPPDCPTGLFRGDLDFLSKHESHRSDKYAKGMVYWGHETLKQIAALEELRRNI